MLVERGDEAPMRLSPDRRQLVIAEAHPFDTGNYSCVAVNAAGRTDAMFAVLVLMTPHFEEFNHVGRRSVLVGSSVSLNCSVSGNPPPQVLCGWKQSYALNFPKATSTLTLTLVQMYLPKEWVCYKYSRRQQGMMKGYRSCFGIFSQRDVLGNDLTSIMSA